MAKKSKKLSPIERKKNVTLFMVLVFSVLLVASSGIANFLVRSVFQIILFGSQLLILKTLLDDYFRTE